MSRLHGADLSFFLTYFLSIISACLGFAKCLKNGVARPIAPGGPVDGLLSGRFILAFIASGCCLVAKGFCINYFNITRSNLDSSTKFHLILLLFLPQLLLAIFSTLDLSSRNSLKILISHPSLILLPVFTFFTFSKIQCCGDRRVKFSVRFTLINMAVSVVAQAVMFYMDWIAIEFLTITGPLTVLGIFFTLSFLYMDKLCSCCCSCFLSAPGQLSVFDPDHPEKNFIIKNEAVEEVIELDEGNIPTVEDEEIISPDEPRYPNQALSSSFLQESVLGPQLEEDTPEAGVEADLHDKDQQEQATKAPPVQPNELEEDLMVNAEKRDREIVQQKAQEAIRTTLDQNQQMTTAAVRAATAAITEAKAGVGALSLGGSVPP